MIRTFRIPHQLDLTVELQQAKIAVDRIMAERKRQHIAKEKFKCPTTSNPIFSDLNIKSTILNQLIKKYWSNKRIKKVSRDPNLQLNHNNQTGLRIERGVLIITPVKIRMDITDQWFWDDHDNELRTKDYIKNKGEVHLYPLSCEISNEYIYLTCETASPARIEPKSWIGVDLNVTGDLVVISDKKTGRVKKYGKEILHKQKRAVHIRANAQRKGKKRFKRREHNVTDDYIKRIARQIAQDALYTDRGIRIEGLSLRTKGKPKSKGRVLNGIISRFPFYRSRFWLQHFCDKMGVVCEVVDPRYTSQSCSRCGCIGTQHTKNRVTTKTYHCVNCGHVDHADANAGFNISTIEPGSVISAWSMICG